MVFQRYDFDSCNRLVLEVFKGVRVVALKSY